MFADLAMTLGGFVLLLGGADYLVRGSVALAKRFGVSPLVIGVTIVALGTSLPELMVSLSAALDGAVGLTAGNIVGSNIANILLILGVSGLMAPIACTRQALFRDGAAMVGATFLFVVAGLLGTLGFWHGLAGVTLLTLYLFGCYWSERRTGDAIHAEEAENVDAVRGSLGITIVAIIGGLAGVLIGADLLVKGATGLARTYGVSEEVIGLTLVAFGTSVPELATAIVAGLRGHTDVSLGNVFGSNLFNTLGIMGVVTMAVPIDMPESMLRFDVWVMIAATVLIVVMLRSGWRLGRIESGFLLVCYGLFIAAQFFGGADMMTG